MEKYFSVVAELSDGKTRVLPVRGESGSQAYQEVRQMPNVRRVGKVTEITPAGFEAILHGRDIPAAPSQSPEPPAAPPAAPQRSDKWVGHVISGPRVIIRDRPSGGEQPFKHLQAPPERPNLPKQDPDQPSRLRNLPRKPSAAVARSATAGQFAPAPSLVVAGEPNKPSPAEYRIVKSRRQGGDPYLLQSGTWQTVKGKRVFHVDWEKGFATRQEAEAANAA